MVTNRLTLSHLHSWSESGFERVLLASTEFGEIQYVVDRFDKTVSACLYCFQEGSLVGI
jgi:hypothetical protein